MTCSHIPLVFAVLGFLLWPLCASGTEPTSSPEEACAHEPCTDIGLVDEIVVSARKREENIQDIPVAITVLPGDSLEERAAVDISEIQSDVPNLSIYPARNQSTTLTAFLRGVGQAEPLWGVDPGVGLYLDDVYIARAQGALLDVFDLERIEVLRGPQGTLYGKNTIGGAIRYLSRPLREDFNGWLALTVGEHGTFDLKASAGGALVPGKLRARVAFASLTREGYGRNRFTGREVSNKETTAFRIGLDWLASEAVTVKLRLDRADDNSEPKGLTRLASSPFCPAFLGRPCDPLSEAFDTESGLEPRNGTESHGASLSVEWALSEAWRFKSITARRESDTLNNIDFDTTPARIVDVACAYQDEQLSQEFQVLFTGRKLSGAFGLFYFDGTAGGVIRNILFNSAFSITSGEVRTESIAVFGEGSLALSDRWTLQVGLRITEEEKRGRSFNADFADDAFTTVTSVISDFDKTAKFSSVAPKLGLDLALSDTLMGYITLSRGFKGGGFNVRAQEQAFPDSAEPYNDEILTMAEVGFKSAFRTLTLNTAAFFGDYDDVQVGTFTSFDDDGDGVDESFFGSFRNAGSATLRGVEAEFDWISPSVDWLGIAGNISYLDATPDEVIDRNNDGFVDTQVITNAPKWTGALHLDLDFPAWGGLITSRLTWSYRDDSTLTSEGGPDPRDPSRPLRPLVQPAFSLFQAGLSWSSGTDVWQISVNGKNLANEEYLLSGYNVPVLGVILGSFGAPRTVTGTVIYRF